MDCSQQLVEAVKVRLQFERLPEDRYRLFVLARGGVNGSYSRADGHREWQGLAVAQHQPLPGV